jgi:hypothetical protein
MGRHFVIQEAGRAFVRQPPLSWLTFPCSKLACSHPSSPSLHPQARGHSQQKSHWIDWMMRLRACLTPPHKGNSARSALTGQGGGRPRPLPASPCSDIALHLLRLPSRARALASTAGCPQTSFFSVLCTPVVLICPWLPEPHSA